MELLRARPMQLRLTFWSNFDPRRKKSTSRGIWNNVGPSKSNNNPWHQSTIHRFSQSKRISFVKNRMFNAQNKMPISCFFEKFSHQKNTCPGPGSTLYTNIDVENPPCANHVPNGKTFGFHIYSSNNCPINNFMSCCFESMFSYMYIYNVCIYIYYSINI